MCCRKDACLPIYTDCICVIRLYKIHLTSAKRRLITIIIVYTTKRTKLMYWTRCVSCLYRRRRHRHRRRHLLPQSLKTATTTMTATVLTACRHRIDAEFLRQSFDFLPESYRNWQIVILNMHYKQFNRYGPFAYKIYTAKIFRDSW